MPNTDGPDLKRMAELVSMARDEETPWEHREAAVDVLLADYGGRFVLASMGIELPRSAA
jgi:hypothetical protein